MELAGIVIGAVGLIVPAYKAVHSLNNHISDVKNFPRKLRSFNAQISLQKKLFDNECILLFSGGFELDESLIREMLGDESHPKWEDYEFQVKFKAHLGDLFDESVVPFTLIRETVHELEKEVVKVTVAGGAKSGSLIHAKGLYRKLQRPSELPALEALLDKLRAQIRDLLHLRTQRETALKRRYRMKELRAVAEAVVEDCLPAVMEVQKASKRVYAAIAAVANCSCHRFYFQLQYETPERPGEKEKEDGRGRSQSPFSGSAESSCFRLVLTTTPQSGGGGGGGGGERAQKNVACTCIAVRKEATEAVSSTPPPPYSILPPAAAATPATPATTTTAKPNKKLQFAYTTTTESANSATLTDLCTTLRHLPPTPSYLGCLPSADPHYRHLYTESQKPSISRISLPRVFQRIPLSPRTRSILPPTRRYRLAWILSASLLRFGFNLTHTSWFRSNWRSRDIYFLQQEDGEESMDFPHISVRFGGGDGDGNGGLDSSGGGGGGTCLAKNEQLYSLAIALIEIAYGDTLQNLTLETVGGGSGGGGGGGAIGGAPAALWNHAREYAAAKDLAESIGQVMSRRYAMVVRRCFYCNFAIDESDMTPARLQRAFYEKVECELRKCMVEFSG